MPDYEIIVFENQDVYDVTTVSELSVVKKYLDYCERYVNPEYVEKNESVLFHTKMMVSYVDRSGGDKPCNVLLLGAISTELLEEIRHGIDKFYEKPRSEPYYMGN